MALKAARAIVDKKGYNGLTARRVAKEIGYTVGTLYLVFKNLDDLIVSLNTETVTELRLHLEQASKLCKDPKAHIPVLAHAYIEYATRHPNSWRLAFEHRLPEGQPVPEALREQTDALFTMVADLIRPHAAHLRDAEIGEIATALWSGVHGICILSLTDKLHLGSSASLQRLTDILIDNFLAGLQVS